MIAILDNFKLSQQNMIVFVFDSIHTDLFCDPPT